MTTDKASEPTQEPSDYDQADTVDDKSEAAGAAEAGAGSDAGPQPRDDGDAAAAPTSESDGGGEGDSNDGGSDGDRTDDGASKEPNQKQLDDLQEDIDGVRAHVEDEVGGTAIHIPETDTDRKVVDRGEEGEVDDTIAPPG